MAIPLRVFIVDDQRMFREGVRSRLEREPDIQVVGEAESASEALTLIEKTAPTVVLVDIRLPDMTGIELARILRQKWPDLKIVALTGYDFDQYVRAMARVGIEGYVLKDSSQETLVQGLRDVAQGGATLAPRVASKIMRNYSASPPGSRGAHADELTVRELDILELMHQGLKNTDIAEHLSISIRTVEAHVSSILAKLGTQTRTEAVLIALRNHLIR